MSLVLVNEFSRARYDVSAGKTKGLNHNILIEHIRDHDLDADADPEYTLPLPLHLHQKQMHRRKDIYIPKHALGVNAHRAFMMFQVSGTAALHSLAKV